MLNKGLKISLILSLMVSGCAFGTRHPVLTYEVGRKPQPVKNIEIYIEKFKDDRLDQEVIGHVRNGWGMKTAKVITTTNIADWVTEALKAELGYIGYNVIDNPNTANVVGGDVVKVYCDSFMSYEGEVGIEVTLNKNGTEVYSRKYLGKEASLNMFSRAKSYGKTLECALQRALIDATHDIERALEKKD